MKLEKLSVIEIFDDVINLKIKSWLIYLFAILALNLFVLNFLEAGIIFVFIVAFVFVSQEFIILFGSKNEFTREVEKRLGGKTKSTIFLSRLIIFTDKEGFCVKEILREIPQLLKDGIFNDELLNKGKKIVYFRGCKVQRISVYRWFDIDDQDNWDSMLFCKAIKICILFFSAILVAIFSIGVYESSLEKERIKKKYTKMFSSNKVSKTYYEWGLNIQGEINKAIFEPKD